MPTRRRPISPVVVGLDGRDGGWDAIALAKRIAPEGKLILVNAYGIAALPPGYSGYAVATREIAQAAGEMLERAAAESAPEADVLALPYTAPGFALRHAADEHEAGMIVIGSAHHGVIGRVLAGDDTRATIHGAPCPVAIAPRGYAVDDAAIDAIVVGFNGTVESRAAVQAAAEIRRDLHARLRVICVAEDPDPLLASYGYALDWPEIANASRAHAERLLHELLAELDDAEGEVVAGRAGKQLESFAEGADLLVIGSRGWGPLRRVLLGSTSDRLVHHAACPVLVVPRPRAGSEAAPAFTTTAGGAG